MYWRVKYERLVTAFMCGKCGIFFEPWVSGIAAFQCEIENMAHAINAEYVDDAKCVEMYEINTKLASVQNVSILQFQ